MLGVSSPSQQIPVSLSSSSENPGGLASFSSSSVILQRRSPTETLMLRPWLALANAPAWARGSP